MHEMSICKNIVEIVVARAMENNAARVRRVDVEVGALRGIVPKYLNYYFDLLKEDTIAAEALLNVITVPGEAFCPGCGTRFALGEGNRTCPDCGDTDTLLVAGMELRVKSMSVD